MALTLYNHHLSPYATRVRIMAYAKGLPIEFGGRPEGLGWKAPEYLALNPVGKIPTLVDNGFAVPESETICEYLEDKYPTPTLRLETPEKRAQVRAITRLLDSYVLVPAQTIIPQMIAQKRDEPVLENALASAAKGFSFIERYFEGPRYAVGDKLTQADCALVPWLAYFLRIFPRTLDRPTVVPPKLVAYFDEVQKDPAMAKAMGEMLPEVEKRVEGVFKTRAEGGSGH